MTKLKCSAVKCMYNEDNQCCKSGMMVDGKEAMKASATSCSDFRERTGSMKNKACCSTNDELKVECRASECEYNKNMMCSAKPIQIQGSNACTSKETECGTFQCK